MGITERRSLQYLKITLLFTAMFSAMGGPALAPALPAIRNSYHYIPDIELWTKALVAISGLFSAIGAPIFGWISDVYGRKVSLLVALVLWAVFGLSGIIPQPFWTLLAGRAMLGLSLGGLLVANTAMIADSFTRNQQRHMMGMQSAFASSGIIVALVIAGWLADMHWRWVFIIFSLGFSIIPFALLLREPDRHNSSSHDAGGVSFTLELFVICVFGFSTMAVFNVIPTQLPFFMKDTLEDIDAAHIGLTLALMPLASVIAGRTYSRVSKKFNIWNWFPFSCLIIFIGFLITSVSQGKMIMLLGLFLIGTGFGFSMPHLNIVLARTTQQHFRGRAMGMLTGFKFTGLFASPFIFYLVPDDLGYRGIFSIAGLMIFSASIIVWLLKFRKNMDMDSENMEIITQKEGS